MKTANPTTVPTKTRHHQALDQLGEDICSGALQPGQVIPPEAQLGVQLGVSRIVVREVVKSLAAKGMLEARRRTGTVILDASNWNPFDPDIIAWRARSRVFDSALARDLLELRRIVEPAAARMAAARANDLERKAMRTAISSMRAALEIESEKSYVEADFDFHTTILSACHNQFVRQMQDAISAILRTSFEFAASIPGGQAHSFPLHEELCSAIEARSPKAAERAMLKIVARAEAELVEWFKLQGTPVPSPM
jgi:GntR family transcriptional regulator, galactonate operon transcriptional repressor